MGKQDRFTDEFKRDAVAQKLIMAAQALQLHSAKMGECGTGTAPIALH